MTGNQVLQGRGKVSKCILSWHTTLSELQVESLHSNDGLWHPENVKMLYMLLNRNVWITSVICLVYGLQRGYEGQKWLFALALFLWE